MIDRATGALGPIDDIGAFLEGFVPGRIRGSRLHPDYGTECDLVMPCLVLSHYNPKPCSNQWMIAIAANPCFPETVASLPPFDCSQIARMQSLLSDHSEYAIKNFCSKHLGECNGGRGATRQSGGRQSPSPKIFQRPDTQLRIRGFCPGIFAFLAVFRVVEILINGVRDALSAKSDFDMPPVGLAATTRHGGSGGGRRFGYFLDRINPGNRYYHKVHVFPVSRPKARTATGHRFDLANPKDGDACGSESTCSGCSRPTIEAGGSGAAALT